MNYTIIFIVLLVIVGCYFLVAYNNFVKKRTMMKEGHSGIDIQLKKRHNLIPNLIETVKGYASHEKDTLAQVIAARNSAMQADSSQAKAQAETQLNSALANIFALGEAYPDLKANTNFLQLQNQLSSIESDIEKSRRYYNATVRENNISIDSFPGNIIAGMFNFNKGDYFEMEDDSQRELPSVKF